MVCEGVFTMKAWGGLNGIGSRPVEMGSHTGGRYWGFPRIRELSAETRAFRGNGEFPRKHGLSAETRAFRRRLRTQACEPGGDQSTFWPAFPYCTSVLEKACVVRRVGGPEGTIRHKVLAIEKGNLRRPHAHCYQKTTGLRFVSPATVQ